MTEHSAERQVTAGKDALCDVPGCDHPSVVLLANDAPLTAPEYAERQACRWHQRNPWTRPFPPARGDA